MSFVEEAVTFDCAGERLVGIVSRPAQPASLGVVIVVGGPQYRAGSHRQFVSLARRLASEGFAVLRFDYGGMGDSEGDQRAFEAVDADIGAAIDKLRQCTPSVQRVALWGLCDGVSAALMYVDRTHDKRVAGLALLNPWVRSEVSLARTRVKHYYLGRLLQRQFWAKLFRGEIAWSAIVGLGRNLRAASQSLAAPAGANLSFQDQMARGWRDFSGAILLLLSEDDYHAHEFLDYTSVDAGWRHTMESKVAQRIDLPNADHTCSTPGSQLAMERATLSWLVDLAANRAGART